MGRVRVRSDGGELPDDSRARLARVTSPSRFIDETEVIDETCGQRPLGPMRGEHHDTHATRGHLAWVPASWRLAPPRCHQASTLSCLRSGDVDEDDDEDCLNDEGG